MEIEKYVQREGHRIFVDIARSGCGSGCKYCYVDTAKKRQELLNEQDVDEISDYLSALNGLSNCFLSFSPNTEPLKSRESYTAVLKIIESVSQYGMPVQISTKERIEPDFLSELEKLAIREKQFFINISIPYIDEVDIMEPLAGKLEERLENFHRLDGFKCVTSCLYIKPFNQMAARKLVKYIKIIQDYKPDYVCVGAAFDIDSGLIQPCRIYYQPDLASELMVRNQIGQMVEFAGNIREKTGVEVTYSTECNIVRMLGISCGVKFYQYRSELCDGCIGRGNQLRKIK